jgi:hypothetical protein
MMEERLSELPEGRPPAAAAGNSLIDSLQLSLASGEAHTSLGVVLDDLPWDRTGIDIPGFPHTAFSIVWHMGACMRSVISRVQSDTHREPTYPNGFWPAHTSPLAKSEWLIAAEEALRCQATMRRWIETRDLLSPVRSSRHRLLLHELLLATQHNAYHIGQLVAYRALIGLPVVESWG